MLQEIVDFAREISREAGSMALKGFRSRETVISYKSRTNLVTNIDKQSEEFLVSAVSKKFPEHSIIAEEGSRKDTDGDYIWYIDPLDGTNNFAHGLPFFCISLGIFGRRENHMVAGAVYAPLFDEMFHTVRGGGSFLNGNRITVSETPDLGISVVATGFPYNKATSDKNNLKEFNAMLPNIQGVRRMGSAAIDLCYVAAGWLDGYWEKGLASWDMAAGSLIAEEAGAAVSRFNGSAFDPEYPEILASNGNIHQQMMDVLTGV